MKWPCASFPCQRPALIAVQAQCELCYQHFCKDHHVSQSHGCPTLEEIDDIYCEGNRDKIEHLNGKRRIAGERMISTLLATIDGAVLSSRAQLLRAGMECQIHLPPAGDAYNNFNVLGGCNYHASIIFKDGQEWLARFRLPNHNRPPAQERNFDRQCEFATYRYLAEAGIPAPQVYEMADDDDPLNHVGAGYILMEKLPGIAMDWQQATEEQKNTFSRQLADIYIKLKQRPMNQLGRLQLSSHGLPVVGPVFFDYDTNGNSTRRGPFADSDDYYCTAIQRQLQLLHTGEITTSFPREVRAMYAALLDNLPTRETLPFYLRHVDSRDANFLVDEEYNITGMIDWELAIVTSKSSAFQSPLLMYDVNELYNLGSSTPSGDEQRLALLLQEGDASDLAAAAAQKLAFRVEMLLEVDTNDWDKLLSVFTGWWKLSSGEAGFEWDEWFRQAQKKYLTSDVCNP